MFQRSRLLLLTCLSLGFTSAVGNAALGSSFFSEDDRSFPNTVLTSSQLLAATPAKPSSSVSPSSLSSSPLASPASPSPSSLSSPVASPPASLNPDPSVSPSSSRANWMWWGTIALIPMGVFAGILFGLHRTTPEKVTEPKASSRRNQTSAKQSQDSLLKSVLSEATQAIERSSHDHPELASDRLTITSQSLYGQSNLLQSQHQSDRNKGETPTTRLARLDIVEELIQELNSADPNKRRKAIWELGQRGDSRAIQPLVDLIVDSDSNQRSLILAAVSEIGVRALKPMHRALLMSIQDDSSDVRKNAIRDVTRIFDLVTQISQLLQYTTSDVDGEVRQTAEWALAQLNRIRPFPSPGGGAHLLDSDIASPPSLQPPGKTSPESLPQGSDPHSLEESS